LPVGEKKDCSAASTPSRLGIEARFPKTQDQVARILLGAFFELALVKRLLRRGQRDLGTESASEPLRSARVASWHRGERAVRSVVPRSASDSAGGRDSPRSRRRSVAGSFLCPSLIALLLIGAFVLRIDGITGPSLATRELHNALLAREYYLGDGAGLPDWQKRVLRELRDSVRPIEPPVLDHLAAASFQLTGGENLWFPRLVSSLLWVVGGIFLYLIALHITRWEGALIALALYLFWPYGVLISRLYMPDPTMIALLLGAALTVIRYWERPSTPRLIAAGVVSAAATSLKPGVAAVFLVVLFAALAVTHRVMAATLVRGRLAVFAALALAPSAAYYVYGTYVSDFLAGESEGRIQPEVLKTAWFWNGWWEMVSIVLPFPQRQALLALVPLAAGLLGIAVAQRGRPRAILLGFLLGYLAYALIFASYTASHAYYALPLIPLLALSIGALAGFMLEHFDLSAAISRRLLIAFLIIAVGIGAFKSRPFTPDDGPIADYRRIGEATGHATGLIVVDERLRSPLMYWGWVVGNYWYPPTPSEDLPVSGDPFPPWIDPAQATFLVVVGLDELGSEPRLREFTRSLPIVARTDRYAVFDLRRGRALAAAGLTG
jgi:4-amino-4-deoxy-L-arabinose transferase-like glycosyltransferase